MISERRPTLALLRTDEAYWLVPVHGALPQANEAMRLCRNNRGVQLALCVARHRNPNAIVYYYDSETGTFRIH